MSRPFYVVNLRSLSYRLIVRIEQCANCTFLVSSDGAALNHNLFMLMVKNGEMKIEPAEAD